MAKQETVRYDKYGLFANGIQLERVTDVSISADFSQENTYQLSDSSIVQKITQTPEVSITVDTNFIGSVDNMRILANKAIDVNSLSTADIRSGSDIRYCETGNGDETYLRYDRIKNSSVNGANNTTDVDHLDILNAYVDLTMPIGEGTTSIGRTLHIHRAALTGYSHSLDVNGYATESYTLSASNRYWFASAWRGVRPYLLSDSEIVATAAAASGANTQQFVVHSVAAFSHSADCVGIFVGVEEAWADDSDFTFYANASSDGETMARYQIANDDVASDTWANPFVSSPTDASRSQCILMLRPFTSTVSQTYAGSTAANPGFEINSTSGSIGALSRYQAEIYVYNTQKDPADGAVGGATSEGRLLRVQSFNVDVSPESESKYQIGDKEAFSVFRQTPVNVTGTFSLLASDLEAQGILSGTEMGADTYYSTEKITASDLNSYNNFEVWYYKEEAKTTKLCTLRVTGFTVSNETINVSVGGEGAEEFSFEADNFYLIPTGENPNI